MTIPNDQHSDARRAGTEVDDIQFESVLEAPPSKVWRALTVPDYVAAWLAPAADDPASLSTRRDSGEPELLDCQVLAAEPPHLLRYAWSEKTEGRVLDSVVTFELSPHGHASTLLRITHGSFILRPAAANLNQPTMLLKDFPEKLIDFSMKKIRKNKVLEESCDPTGSQLALAA